MSLAHHWRVYREALAADRSRRKGFLASDEVDFLPAALEVIEKPVSPTARVVTWAALVFLVITILWLVFGRVDVVASASGKIVPVGSVKLVQSPGSGVVGAIYVRNGDIVKAGQKLLDLDPTLSSADLTQAQKALAAAELDAARARAIADALGGGGVRFVAPPGTPPEIAVTQTRLIAAQLAETEATIASLSAARASSLSDAQAADAQIAKLGRTLPLLDRQVAALSELDRQGYAPGQRFLELQRQRQSEAGDRDVAIAQRARGLSEARKLAEQAGQTREGARRVALTELAKAEADVILRREEVTKASQRRSFQSLEAPVDGTIQQLAVNTVGGVIEPARTLMVVVPSGARIEVEARVLNKDIGFVRVGQEAAVKLEAFSFTRYGAVPGRVVALSPDAVPDPKLGPVYIARIVLDRRSIIVDGREVGLGPGLNATVDIKTGTRAIISYLISPLQTTFAQAGRER
jgi:hemolysin D